MRADMLCGCGSVLSAVTFTCVRGRFCPRERKTETVILRDGPAEQALVLGVEPVSLAQRQIEQEQRRRALRRGSAPVGGLFDETERKQGELF